MNRILFITGMIFAVSVASKGMAEPSSNKVSVSISESSLSINEYTLDIETLEADLKRQGLKPATGGSWYSSFEKEQYPITFYKHDDESIDSVIIHYDWHPFYSQVDIRVGNLSISNQITVEDFKNLMEVNGFSYSELISPRAREDADSVSLDLSFHSGNPFSQAYFRSNQLSFIQINLGNETSGSPVFWDDDLSAFSTSRTSGEIRTHTDESVDVTMSNSTLKVDGYKFNLMSLEADMKKHGLAVLREEVGVMIKESSFHKENYPISFIQNKIGYSGPYIQLYVSFYESRRGYRKSVIQLEGITIDNATTIGDIENHIGHLDDVATRPRRGPAYRKYVGANDTVRFKTSDSAADILDIGFVSNKIAYVELNLAYPDPR